MNCPACNSRSVGRVGSEYYYCWDCCIEFSRTGSGLQAYALEADGDRVAVALAAPPVPVIVALSGTIN